MHGSRLFVDVSVLEGLERELYHAAGNLEQLGRRLACASAGDLGTKDLDAAAEHFFDRWKYGTDQLGKAADVVAQQVGEALRVYHENDVQLAEVFRSER